MYERSELDIQRGDKNKPSDYTFRHVPVPHQGNTWDCGPCVCYNAKCLLLNHRPFSESFMQYFRHYMLREILVRETVP